MQLEEKILPATVVQYALKEKIKQIKVKEDRKIYQKEKNVLKDEIIYTLLPRAFSRISRVYAYIDTKHDLLIIDSTIPSKIAKVLDLFNKSFGNNSCHALTTKKIAPILTRWLLQDEIPKSFTVEDSCVLRDPQRQNRIIRCQHQDLSFSAIQSLLNDGCDVHQLSLNWQDKISFVLTEDFGIKSIKYNDDVMSLAKDDYGGSPEQKFHADFHIMTATLSALIVKLMRLFQSKKKEA